MVLLPIANGIADEAVPLLCDVPLTVSVAVPSLVVGVTAILVVAVDTVAV